MNEFIVKFDELFGGRRDNYARGVPKDENPNKYRWYRVEEPLTAKIFSEHMKGIICVGIYPIVEGDVKWFAVDFDGPKDKLTKEPVPNAFDIAFESAKKQQQAFDRAGLHTYIERSRSGLGCHIWGFLTEWMDAQTVRKAVESLMVIPPKQDGRDLLYPVQDDVAGLDERMGNLLALPFYGAAVPEGCSVFITETGAPIPPREFLPLVRTNFPAVIERIADEAPELPERAAITPQILRAVELHRENPLVGALKMLSPFGCSFMRYCWENRKTLGEEEWYTALGQCTYFEYGRELAHLISKDYVKYNPNETNKKFDQALKSPGRGCQYIHERFPEQACTDCPMKAPYHVAKKSILELAGETTDLMERLGNFQDDINLVREYNAGLRRPGYSWGIPSMDSLTLLRPSELTIVGGWPNMGKTWLLVDSAYGMAEQGTLAFVFSPETSRQPLRHRFLARASSIELQRLRGESPYKLTPDEYAQIDRAAAHLESLPIYTDFSTLDPETVLKQVERSLLSNSISLDAPYAIIFDYLQFGLRNPGEEQKDLINRLAGEFKYTAKILEHPVAVYSQLRRATEGQDEPLMNWFAESAGIERNMDVGIVMTGERMGGLYAPRILTSVKQREGEAQKQLKFLLHQGYGKFEVATQDTTTAREDLTKDFG